MRTFDVIKEDIAEATVRNNSQQLFALAEELSRIETEPARALVQRARGVAFYAESDYANAVVHFQAAIDLYGKLCDEDGVAGVTASLGMVKLNEGDISSGLVYIQRGLTAYQKLGNEANIALLTGTIGTVYLKMADFTTASEYLHKALNYEESTGNRIGMARSLGNIGLIYEGVGEYGQALEYYRRALNVNEELHNESGISTAYSNIGGVYWRMGDFATSLEFHSRSLEICKQVGDRGGVARETGNIGIVFESMQEFESALGHFQRSAELNHALGQRYGFVQNTNSVVCLLLRTGEIAEAVQKFETIDASDIVAPELLIALEVTRGRIQSALGNNESAITILLLALATSEHHTLKWEQTEIHRYLRDIYRSTANFEGYVKHNDAHQKITDETQGKEATLKIAMQEKQRELDAKDREHQKHMAVLHSTLPKHIADRVARGEVVTDHFDSAAVLFLDVVGFTVNSTLLPPADVVGLLQEIFTKFDSICAKHNVTKIKTIGDSYMAVAFPDLGTQGIASRVEQETPSAENGTSGKAPSPIENLTLTAIDMISVQFSWSHNSTPVEFRIGLHCGPVVAGVIGTQRMQYDVWGDTVNVASRMESTSEPGRIHVSEAFFVGATHASPSVSSLTFTPRGEIEVKGKGSMRTFWLTTIKD